MKKILILFALLLLSNLYSQSTKELILGNWKIDQVFALEDEKIKSGQDLYLRGDEIIVEFAPQGKGKTISFNGKEKWESDFSWEFLEEKVIQFTTLSASKQKGKAIKMYVLQLNKKRLILIARRKIDKIECQIKVIFIRQQKEENKKDNKKK